MATTSGPCCARAFRRIGSRTLPTPPAETLIDHVPYRFFIKPAVDLQRHELDLYVAGYARQLRELCRAFRPSVIHAASFFRNGLAAAQVGAELGIPVIYELRVLSILDLLPVRRAVHRAQDGANA